MSFLTIKNLGIPLESNFDDKKSVSINVSAGLICLFIVLTLPIVIVLVNIFEDRENLVKVISFALQSLLFLFISFAILKKKGVDFLSAFKKYHETIGRDIVLASKYFIGFLIVIQLFALLKIPLHIDNISYESLQLNYFLTPFKMSMYLFITCILVPISEEVFFKRIIYVSFRKVNSILKSVLILSIIFSSLHYPYVFYMFLWSCISCFIYERYKNLQVNIIFHGLTNFCAVLYSAWIIR